jgi:hypothetical protein
MKEGYLIRDQTKSPNAIESAAQMSLTCAHSYKPQQQSNQIIYKRIVCNKNRILFFYFN